MAVGRVLFSVLMAGQLLVAGAVIGLVATKLNKINLAFDASKLSAKVNDTCLLGQTANGISMCYLAYGFSGVSILATAALSILMCCTCNLCGLGFLLDTVFAAVGTAWWAVAAVMFRYNFMRPEVAALPQGDMRHWLVVLAWAGCGLFGAAFLVNLYRILAKCCACCGSGGDRRDVESGGRRGRGGSKAQQVVAVPYYAPGAPPPGYPGRKGGGQFIAGDVGPNPWGRY